MIRDKINRAKMMIMRNLRVEKIGKNAITTPFQRPQILIRRTKKHKRPQISSKSKTYSKSKLICYVKIILMISSMS